MQPQYDEFFQFYSHQELPLIAQTQKAEYLEAQNYDKASKKLVLLKGRNKEIQSLYLNIKGKNRIKQSIMFILIYLVYTEFSIRHQQSPTKHQTAYSKIRVLIHSNRHPLKIDQHFSKLAKSFSKFKYLSKVIIITDGPIANDCFPNWTHEIKIPKKIIKIQRVTKMILKEGATIEKQLLQKMTVISPTQKFEFNKDGSEPNIVKQFSKIKEWYCQSFQYSTTSDPNSLLKDLVLINFSRLKILSFWNNNIQSIEQITKMQMPLLKEIYLSANQIMTSRPLIKLHLSNLKILKLCGNNLLEGDDLTKGFWPSLQEIAIQYYSQKCQCFSIHFAAKLQKRKNSLKLNVHSNYRIDAYALYESLSKKGLKPSYYEKSNDTIYGLF